MNGDEQEHASTHKDLTKRLLQTLQAIPPNRSKDSPPDTPPSSKMPTMQEKTLQHELAVFNDMLPHIFTAEFEDIHDAILELPQEKRYAAATEFKEMLEQALKEKED